jgi:hypothetical protein
MVECNTEAQMHTRLRRPGQKLPITTFRLIATNARAEGLIILKQRLKATYNERLMAVVTLKTPIGDKFKGSWHE